MYATDLLGYGYVQGKIIKQWGDTTFKVMRAIIIVRTLGFYNFASCPGSPTPSF